MLLVFIEAKCKQEARVLVFRKGLDVSNILIIAAGDMTQVLINEEVIK
jgi:hypothetical protein